jgi:hypothetical protein
MKVVERHPLLASAVGGVLFALVILVGSGATRSSGLGPVDAVLALAVGAAFAFAMHRSMRARRPPRL